MLIRTVTVGYVQTPGFGITSKFPVCAPAVSVDALVRNSHGDAAIAAPLHFPVTAQGKTVSGQNLSPAAEALRVFWVMLRFKVGAGLPVALSETDVRVGCVWVQHHITTVYVQKDKQLVWDTGKIILLNGEKSDYIYLLRHLFKGGLYYKGVSILPSVIDVRSR